MATRHRVPTNDLLAKENVNKLKKLPGKVGVLPSQGITRRKVLGEMTNQTCGAVDKKQMLKKATSITTLKDKKPTVSTFKPAVPAKPEPAINHEAGELTSQGLAKRKVLGGLTEQARIAVDKKPLVKKVTSVTTLKDKKPSSISTLKPVVPAKSEPIVNHEEINKPEDKKKSEIYVPVAHDKVEKEKEKTVAYSVHHFGFLDEKDTDPLLVPCYVNDIIYHLRTIETEYLVNEMFLAAHKTNSRMRAVLIDWLVGVHLHFRMEQETLYLAVSIVDRYLEKNKTIGRETLQLVGVAALFVASKYEDTYAPEIEDFVHVCDNAFSQKKILQMEQSILKTLDFKLGNPCSLHFLRRYSRVGKVKPIHHILAKYLLELALVKEEFSSIAPSLQASSALCISVQLLKGPDFSLTDDKIIAWIEHVSGYTRRQMTPVIKNLSITVLKTETSKYQAVKSKYATMSNSGISSRSELKNGVIKKLAEMK